MKDYWKELVGIVVGCDKDYVKFDYVGTLDNVIEFIKTKFSCDIEDMSLNGLDSRHSFVIDDIRYNLFLSPMNKKDSFCFEREY